MSARGGSKLTQNRFQKLPQGSRVEISPASWEVARGIGKLFPSGGQEKGAGLVVDYGGDKAFGRSWRVSVLTPCLSAVADLIVRYRVSANIRLWIRSPSLDSQI